MPTVLRVKGYAFGFFAGDVDEPPHVHVTKEAKEAKYWLEPMSLARNRGFAAHELTRIERIIRENRETLLEAWHEYFRRS